MPAALRRVLEEFELAVVAIEDHVAAGNDALENLGLGGGDLLYAGEIAQMAGAIVVMIATSGRTMRDSGAISPAWFMPISNTP